MTTTNPIASYVNGDYRVTIFPDGTKVRVGEGAARLPESADIKITNYCDNSRNCPFCHEMSTTQGAHGDLNQILNLYRDMPAGVELALGGGNPLSHPQLIPFLRECKQRGHICNITVNQFHLEDEKQSDVVRRLQTDGLIRGVGISVRNVKTLFDGSWVKWIPQNAVYHLILGINSFKDMSLIMEQKIGQINRVLLLGYKTFGWGIAHKMRHDNRISESLRNWARSVPVLFSHAGIVSFDNLAIDQLALRRWMSPDHWSQFFMGQDGQFTMYVDAVKGEFAQGSTSTARYPVAPNSRIEDLFRRLSLSS